MCQSGDTEVMCSLYETHKDIHFKYCCRLTNSRHDAEDLFQNAWLKAMNGIRYFDVSKPFKNWLFRITTNIYRDKYRKAKRWLGISAVSHLTEDEGCEPEYIDPSSTVEEQVEDKELKARLVSCLYSLEDKYRIPLMLFYFNEISYVDISQILELPMGTLKTRLNKGKKKIYKMIGGFYSEK